VHCRGLPWKASDREIAEFFGGLRIVPNGIDIVRNPDGRPSGDGYVEFESMADAKQALTKHKQHMGPRWVEVYLSNGLERRTAIARGGGGERGGPPRGYHDRDGPDRGAPRGFHDREEGGSTPHLRPTARGYVSPDRGGGREWDRGPGGGDRYRPY